MDKTLVVTTINENRDRLNNISKEIWANPEGSFEEKHAHDILTQFFTEEGFEVERNYISATGFKATFGSSEGENRGIHVCFLCEYDAIPDLGHAAGHNLCSEASAAAALAIKRCIQQKKVGGKVTVLGAPAENSTGGTKIDMIQKNAFDTVDIGMMLTAMNSNIVYPKHYLLVVVNVSYKGKSAHASAFPWEGRNALDAAVACYNNISLMRQQLKPTWMVNGIITKGGVQPNLIPDYSELKLWLRAPTHMDLVHIQQKCQACIVAAAKATGCEAQFSFDDKMYYPMQHNEKLGEMYKNHAQDMGLNMDEQPSTYQLHTGKSLHLIGSTDMGNVSQIIPCINPSFDIGTRASHYSKAFQEAAGSDTAHENAIRAATALALTAADVMSDPSTLEVIKSEYTPYKSASGHMLLKHRSVSSDSHH